MRILFLMKERLKVTMKKRKMGFGSYMLVFLELIIVYIGTIFWYYNTLASFVAKKGEKMMMMMVLQVYWWKWYYNFLMCASLLLDALTVSKFGVCGT